MQDVGNFLPLKDEVKQQLELVTIKGIYNDWTSKNLAQCRPSKWSKMKKKSTTRIPPDADTHNLHSQRVNYQCYVFLFYKNKFAPPSPNNHGWTTINGINICGSTFNSN